MVLGLVLSPTPIVANPITIPSKDAGWLETLNYYRLSSGVEPVTENPIFSANAMKHSIYLAKSDPKFFTGIYENSHTENPESPYYTKEGANSGTNLTYTARESDAIDSWMQAPLHAIGLLRDNLKTTGYATAINDRTGLAHTGLDVINGLVGSRQKIITFPGNGAIVRLNKFEGESPDPRESCGKDWENFRGLPIFASLISTPPRDITGKIVTPDGKTLLPGSELCVVTQYSWVSTDRVISYGDQIMAGEKLVLLIAKSPLNPGAHSVSISGTGISPLNWSFTVLQPLPKIVPTFDIDKRMILWNPVTVPVPGLMAGYTVIATDRASNRSKEYRTNAVSLSTVDWTAGEYWLCVKVRSSNDESECDFQFARVFEKLPTVKFYMDPNVEEITWDPIVVSDPDRKFDYVVKAWSRTTDKITDFPANERKFSTLNWDDGGYWVCVQAKAPGAESLCSTYWSYTIDRKAIAAKAAADKAAAELKAKQEAEAKAAADKAAAELKAKQEAEAIAAAELRAKQEADLKAKQEAEDKAAAEKAAAELKAKQEAEAKAKAVASKKRSITCVKGKLVKKVTGVGPKCPSGYKLKR
jgi:hypothetical protein